MAKRNIEIDEAIKFIHQNLHEPINLKQLARYVSYSPYHFSRMFKEEIGLPPLYYLSALRLQKAKELLLKTNFSIRDISLEVGQQSLGTFTSRFTEKVGGVTPSVFRQSTTKTEQQFQQITKMPDFTQQTRKVLHNTIYGHINATQPFLGIVLIGLFSKPIPEGFPLYGLILPSLGEFYFSNVKPGRYYLLATSVSMEMNSKDILLTNTNLRAKRSEPIFVNHKDEVPAIELTLRSPKMDDPPILISISALMQQHINKINPLYRDLANSNRLNS